MEANNIEIAEKIPASRKLQRTDAAGLLAKAKSMTVSKGKKMADFKGGKSAASDAIDAMLGSTGNLRAPTLVVGNKLIVGFNEALYQQVFEK
ncbi:MAG: arsenate reductase-like glutaredoxin family protein [Limisphaerales bacterium]